MVFAFCRLPNVGDFWSIGTDGKAGHAGYNRRRLSSRFKAGTVPVVYRTKWKRQEAMPGAALAGELYGVHWAPDSLASTESTVGGYTLFPDINRVEWHSFMALGDE